MRNCYEILNSTAYDLLVLMFRMANEKRFSEAIRMHDHHDIEAEKWIEDFIFSSRYKLPEKIKDLLLYLFDWDLHIGLSFIKYIWLEKIPNGIELIKYIRKMAPLDITKGFIEDLEDNDIEYETLSKLIENKEEAKKFVFGKLKLSQTLGKRVIDILGDPDKFKKELLFTFEWSYENIYREKEEEIAGLITESERKLQDLLNKNEKALGILIDNEMTEIVKIPIGISAFYETARFEITLPGREKNLYLTGYKYPELASKHRNSNPLQELFKILADDENFRIIISLSESEKTFLTLVANNDLPLERTLEKLDLLVKKRLVSFNNNKATYSVDPEVLAGNLSDLIIEKLKTSED